jgi:hypothetical protein
LVGIFWDRVLQTICLGCLVTMILLISVFWIARIIGMSHQCLAISLSLSLFFFFLLVLGFELTWAVHVSLFAFSYFLGLGYPLGLVLISISLNNKQHFRNKCMGDNWRQWSFSPFEKKESLYLPKCVQGSSPMVDSFWLSALI